MAIPINNTRLMKKFLSLLLAALCAALLTVSCSPVSLSAHMRLFVSDVEANYKHYSQEQWDEANATYARLCDEFKTKKLTMSQEEKNEFREYQGRYAAVVAKAAVEDVQESVQEIVPDSQEVESFLKGGFKSDTKE